MNLIIQPALLQYQNRGEVKERILIFIHNEISKQVVYYINNTIFPISYNVNRNLENFLKVENINYRYISTDYMLININSSEDLLVRCNTIGNTIDNFINIYGISFLINQKSHSINYSLNLVHTYAVEIPKLEPVKASCKTEILKKIYEDIAPFVNIYYFPNLSMENIFYTKSIAKYVIITESQISLKKESIKFSFLNLLEDKIPYIYNGKELTEESFLLINGGI